MPKFFTQPEVVMCISEHEADRLAAADPNGAALTASTPSLARHKLIAEHGAGVVKTIYTEPSTLGKWRAPAGCTLRFSAAISDPTNSGFHKSVRETLLPSRWNNR